MLSKNARVIEKEMNDLEKSIEKGLENPDQLKEYRDKSSDLRDKYRPENMMKAKDLQTKEAVGGAVADLKKEEDKLEKEYKDVIEEFKKERDEMMEEEADIDIFTIPLKHVPEEVTGAIMTNIYECITDE